MGLASDNSVASWRTCGGTSGGTEVAMPQSYGQSRRKNKPGKSGFQERSILLVYAHVLRRIGFR